MGHQASSRSEVGASQCFRTQEHAFHTYGSERIAEDDDHAVEAKQSSDRIGQHLPAGQGRYSG